MTLAAERERSSVESLVAQMAGCSVVKRTGRLVVKKVDRSASR